MTKIWLNELSEDLWMIIWTAEGGFGKDYNEYTPDGSIKHFRGRIKIDLSNPVNGGRAPAGFFELEDD